MELNYESLFQRLLLHLQSNYIKNEKKQRRYLGGRYLEETLHICAFSSHVNNIPAT